MGLNSRVIESWRFGGGGGWEEGQKALKVRWEARPKTWAWHRVNPRSIWCCSFRLSSRFVSALRPFPQIPLCCSFQSTF